MRIVILLVLVSFCTIFCSQSYASRYYSSIPYKQENSDVQEKHINKKKILVARAKAYFKGKYGENWKRRYTKWYIKRFKGEKDYLF